MSVKGKFMIFCLEIYKSKKNLTGKQAMQLFKRYEIIDYILSCYDALHTTGENYIIEDIDEFIKVRQFNL